MSIIVKEERQFVRNGFRRRPTFPILELPQARWELGHENCCNLGRFCVRCLRFEWVLRLWHLLLSQRFVPNRHVPNRHTTK